VTVKVSNPDDEDHEGEEVVICALSDTLPMCSLDLLFETYTEFSIKGKGEVHLSGYYLPMDDEMEGMDDEEDGDFLDDDSDEDESDEGEELDLEAAMKDPKMRKAMKQLRESMLGRGDDDDDEDDEDDDDDDDDDDDSSKGDSDVDDDDDDDSEEDSDGNDGRPKQGTEGIIGEVKDEEKKEDNKTTKKKATAEVSTKKRPAEATPVTTQSTAVPPSKVQKSSENAAKKATPSKGAAAATPAATATATASPSTPGEPKPVKGMVREFDNGFKMEYMELSRNPTAKTAKGGNRVEVRYTGKLASNGKVFDQTKGRATFTFRLGVGEVIKGWDRGVVGMRVGEKRRLTVPPQMGYGSSGIRGVIPPNATLVFDVELVSIK